MRIERKVTEVKTFNYDFYGCWDEQLMEWRFVAKRSGTNNYCQLSMDSTGKVIIMTNRPLQEPPLNSSSWPLGDNPIINLMWLQQLEENKRFGRDPIKPLDYNNLNVEVW